MKEPLHNLQIPSINELLGNLNDGYVMELFFIYSRFEYALKCIPKYRGSGPHGTVRPELGIYASSAGKAALVSINSPMVEDAVTVLNDAPPKIQKSDLGWHDNHCDKTDRYERAIIFAKDVRNNLFHGGKYSPQGLPNQNDKTRNNSIILAAINIVKGCLLGDAELSKFFGASIRSQDS